MLNHIWLSSYFCIVGYPLTEKDFENGRKIDEANQIPNGAKNPLDDAFGNGTGNYQGDMILTPDQLKEVQGRKRGLTPFSVHLWPFNGKHAIIPYTISDNSFTSSERANIARAVEDFDTNTCIR